MKIECRLSVDVNGLCYLSRGHAGVCKGRYGLWRQLVPSSPGDPAPPLVVRRGLNAMCAAGYGSMSEIRSAPPAELMELHGVKEALVAAVLEFGRINHL